MNKKQRNGVFSLLILLVLFQVGLFFKNDIFEKFFFQNNNLITKEIEIFKKEVKIYNQKKITAKKKKKIVKRVKKELILKNFNPNVLNEKSWQELGFSKKQTQIILNYKNKKGGFETKEDLKKVFVISNQKYKQLAPYIKIPAINKININIATENDLQKVKGISKKMSKMIIEYRNNLGGFAHLKFVMKIYNIQLKPYLEKGLKKYFTFNSKSIKKININTADFKVLNKHPFLNYTQTKSIVNFRTKMRKFKSINELLNLETFTQKDIEKIKYYFKAK